jgi:hypothetical protein
MLLSRAQVRKSTGMQIISLGPRPFPVSTLKTGERIVRVTSVGVNRISVQRCASLRKTVKKIVNVAGRKNISKRRRSV